MKKRSRALGSTREVHDSQADAFAESLRIAGRPKSCEAALDVLELAVQVNEHRASAGSWSSNDALGVGHARVGVRKLCGCTRKRR